VQRRSGSCQRWTASVLAHGSIDDLAGLRDVATACGAHLHVDAAWAGALALVPERRPFLAGIEAADSVTIDAHKWLCIPMGAGMYLARDWSALQVAFSVATGYTPSASVERRDAYLHSMQWSRRFIGLKLFLAFAVSGLAGVQARIGHQFALGGRLRAGLVVGGWSILNDTPIPLVCFAPGGEVADDAAVRAIEGAAVRSGGAWISAVRLRGRLVLRACVTSYETSAADVDALLDLLRGAVT
jgi:glutamate/tyrosine decarboxylase-like PLP-dependent enzyme